MKKKQAKSKQKRKVRTSRQMQNAHLQSDHSAQVSEMQYRQSDLWNKANGQQHESALTRKTQDERSANRLASSRWAGPSERAG
jgi:hypothetical protein